MGFILALTIVAPILMSVISFFEFVTVIPIYYQIINPLLYQNFIYMILVLGLIVIIILLATYKRIKEIIEK
jgi:hypothetical protein